MKRKVTQSDPTESNTATILEAYEALSQEALALWLRLHYCSDEQLSAGRARLAREVLKISETRTHILLRELRLKGYVAIHSSGPLNPSRVELLKRCKIVGRTRFITLSRMAAPMRKRIDTDTGINAEGPYMLSDEVSMRQIAESGANGSYMIPTPTRQQLLGPDSERSRMLSNASFETDSNEVSMRRLNGDSAMPRVTYEDEHWLLPVWNENVPRRPAAVKSKRIRSIERSMDSMDSGPGASSKGCQLTDVRSAAEDSAQVWGKLVPTLLEVMDLFSVHGSKSVHAGSSSTTLSGRRGGSIDLNKLIKLRLRQREKREVLAKRGPCAAVKRLKHPASGQPIDWTELDKTGAPVISFNPAAAQREGMIHLLTAEYRRLRPRERTLRTALLSKLRTEFIRIYTRYRRAALLEMDANSTYYEVHPSEHKYAEKVAVSCILKGVTPIQVLRYWHKNIRRFANAKMAVPPLTFLSQASFIDEVAIAVLTGSEDVSGGVGVAPDAGKGWKPPKRKTMWLGDTSTLHPRLRRDLVEAGFDVSKYNDSDLACIQDYAMDIKSGMDYKLYPEVLRPMIKWALKHTLKDIDPKDTLWNGA